MRRLPIYFLIDVSESMVGEPIQQVEEGLATIIKELKTDPNSIETVWVSIIVFAGQAKTLVPLQEIVNFYPPRFPVGSGTSLSRALGHLMFELRKNQVTTTMERKGDWKPIVFLFTDGVPTDNTKIAIGEWKQNWQRTANM
ncbi:MAG: VWA domain-containing protein, partial [Bacteroidetes bacterium]|nr:VWA domain-containing protein [Bacteroidota bacterium]